MMGPFIVILMELLPFIMAVCDNSTVDHIDFKGKGITQVNEALFRNCNPAAKTIDLSDNQITQLDANAFASFDKNSKTYVQQFYQLETLTLDNNQISSINVTTFAHTRILKSLSMKYNRLQSLQSGLFDHSLKYYLENLDISHNEISAIGMSVFTSSLSKLRTVDLSYNNMTYMEAWPYIPPVIILFNLSHNKIDRFTNDLKWTYDLQEPYHAYVDLKNNSFRIWDDKWFRQYQEPDGDFVGDFVTYQLDMTYNPWVCDCQMHYMASKIQDSFYKYADTELLHVECEDPPNLRRKRIINIDLNDFVCDVKVDCPDGCHCTNRSEIKHLDVNCKVGNLTKLPFSLPNIPDRKIVLDVSNNSIREINSRPYADKLVTLNAEFNKLVFIDQETVKNMTQQGLRMNISNNQLQYLPNPIQNVDFISIYNNPFKCNCNMTWMAGWLDLDSIETRDKQVTCQTDNGDIHKIIDVTEGLLDCNYNTEIGLAVGFGILLIVVVIGIVWAKRCPYETKVLVFKFFRYHPSDKYKVDKENTKEYDIYVSFDDTNVHIRQWVLKKLKKRLEERKHRLFIPVIDLTLGEDKGDEIVRKMELSRRVIILLSDKYDENEWSVFECQQAEMLTPNDGRIIFIKYHPEAEDMVQNEPWKSRVKDRKVLAIGEKSSERRWFWDKLKYELPVK